MSAPPQPLRPQPRPERGSGEHVGAAAPGAGARIARGASACRQSRARPRASTWIALSSSSTASAASLRRCAALRRAVAASAAAFGETAATGGSPDAALEIAADVDLYEASTPCTGTNVKRSAAHNASASDGSATGPASYERLSSSDGKSSETHARAARTRQARSASTSARIAPAKLVIGTAYALHAPHARTSACAVVTPPAASSSRSAASSSASASSLSAAPGSPSSRSAAAGALADVSRHGACSFRTTSPLTISSAEPTPRKSATPSAAAPPLSRKAPGSKASAATCSHSRRASASHASADSSPPSSRSMTA
jgi:hypothetical protein